MMTLHSVRWLKWNSMSNYVGQHFVGALISTYHNHLNWVPVPFLSTTKKGENGNQIICAIFGKFYIIIY